MAKRSISNENVLKTLVAYQIVGIFLFALGTNALQYTGIALRIVLLFSSATFLFIVSTVSKPMRFLFYFFLFAPILFIESLSLISIFLKIAMISAVFVAAAALSFHQFQAQGPLKSDRLLQRFDFLILKISRVCKRVLGPIVIEWIFITFVSFLWTTLRFISRMLSYASLQRHFATSLLILLVILLLVLRH